MSVSPAISASPSSRVGVSSVGRASTPSSTNGASSLISVAAVPPASLAAFSSNSGDSSDDEGSIETTSDSSASSLDDSATLVMSIGVGSAGGSPSVIGKVLSSKLLVPVRDTSAGIPVPFESKPAPVSSVDAGSSAGRTGGFGPSSAKAPDGIRALAHRAIRPATTMS